ncbi:MAG: adenylate/guanylate cyclase domain-containing protein, partial [Hyphomicrobiaceae bacterium]
GADTYIVKSSGASGEIAFGTKSGVIQVRIGQAIVPTDAFGQMWLQFTASDRRRYVPAWKLLEGQVDKQDIEGRIVLVGTSAAGLFDLRTTPLDGAVPGVEIHAQAIEQMLTGSYLQRPDLATGLETIALVLFGVLMALAVYVTGALWSAVLGTAILALGIVGSWAAYVGPGWLFDPIYPTLALTLLYIVTTGFVYVRTEIERNRVRHAFSHYMAPAVVEELARNPEKLKLGGESRCVTLLFCDVRGFSSIAERLDAQALTQFLNRLLTPLSNTILEHRGTIDKYIGDAIMAFWNAPLDDSAHADNACRVSLAMVQDLVRLNGAWEAEAVAKGTHHVPVRIGIGLNTADCCVGNLGSERRFDYSVIGDGVNVASRLEGQSKIYGVPIVVGEATMRAAADFAFLELDLLSVMGKQEAIHIYALLGDKGYRESSEFRALARHHNAMLAAYRGRRFDDALALIEPAKAAGGAQLTTLYDLYAKRIAAFLHTPPPLAWDGRAISESK